MKGPTISQLTARNLTSSLGNAGTSRRLANGALAAGSGPEARTVDASKEPLKRGGQRCKEAERYEHHLTMYRTLWT